MAINGKRELRDQRGKVRGKYYDKRKGTKKKRVTEMERGNL